MDYALKDHLSAVLKYYRLPLFLLPNREKYRFLLELLYSTERQL